MQFLRFAIGSLGVQLLGVLLSFLLALLLARGLGPESYGVYAFCFSLILILGIPVHSALPTLIVRQVARQQQGGVRPLLRKASNYIGLYVLLLIVLLVVWGVFLGGINADRWGVLLCGVALIPLQALSLVRGAALRGIGRVVLGQLPETVLRPLFFLVLAAGWMWFVHEEGESPAFVMAFHVLAAFFALVVADVVLRRTLVPVNCDFQELQNGNWFSSIAPLTCVAGLQVVNQQLDILLLGGLQSDAAVGVYRVAVQLATLVGFGLIAINQMLHPQFSRLYAEGDRRALQALVTLSSRVITGIALLAAGFFWIAGDWVLIVVFGEHYQSAYLPLVILVVGQVANAVFGSVGALLNMTGHEKDTLFGMLLACAVNLIVGLILIPEHGMLGAAVATSASFLVWNLVLWLFVRKRLGIESTAFFFRRDRAA